MLLEDLIVAGTRVEIRSLTAGNPLTNQVQQRLVDLTLLDPPVDGDFGPLSRLALQQFAKLRGFTTDDTIDSPLAKALLESTADELLPVTPHANLAGRIFRCMAKKRYSFPRLRSYFTIVYLEGVTPTGRPNDNKPNAFNDRRLVLAIKDNVPVEVGNWQATTEPGKDYTEKPLDPKGAARIAFGQYKAWRIGMHPAGKPTAHEALVQVGTVRVHRDLNKDYRRDGDVTYEGSSFGLNQHWGYDMPEDKIGVASAGCLVGRSRDEHREFMRVIKTDPRIKASSGYRFLTAILSGTEVAAMDS